MRTKKHACSQLYGCFVALQQVRCIKMKKLGYLPIVRTLLAVPGADFFSSAQRLPFRPSKPVGRAKPEPINFWRSLCT
jgi:hypothetical protein